MSSLGSNDRWHHSHNTCKVCLKMINRPFPCGRQSLLLSAYSMTWICKNFNFKICLLWHSFSLSFGLVRIGFDLHSLTLFISILLSCKFEICWIFCWKIESFKSIMVCKLFSKPPCCLVTAILTSSAIAWVNAILRAPIIQNRLARLDRALETERRNLRTPFKNVIPKFTISLSIIMDANVTNYTKRNSCFGATNCLHFVRTTISRLINVTQEIENIELSLSCKTQAWGYRRNRIIVIDFTIDYDYSITTITRVIDL